MSLIAFCVIFSSVYPSSTEGTLTPPFSLLLLQHNSRFVGVKLLQVYFSKASEIFGQNKRIGIRKSKVQNETMVRITSGKQIQKIFTDFSRTNYRFQGQNTSWSYLRFLLLRPSLITLFYTTFRSNTLQNYWV